MMGSEWLYAAIALLVGLHVLTMLYAYRSQGEPAAAITQQDSETPPSPSDSENDESVHCPHCGEMNERDYRFCKRCVADLSGSASQQRPVDRGQPY
jgi:uncharacterized paraquat-inducible protein A